MAGLLGVRGIAEGRLRFGFLHFLITVRSMAMGCQAGSVSRKTRFDITAHHCLHSLAVLKISLSHLDQLSLSHAAGQVTYRDVQSKALAGVLRPF